MIDKKLEKILLKIEKPSRYIGGEVNSINKKLDNIKTRFAFCFPDTYEIGMSHLGMKILYSVLNEQPDIFCERVFAPALDMRNLMISNKIPLYGLESLDPIKDFDIIGFTLQYELSYTNVLAMLELADIPILAKDRVDSDPVIIAGGPCACNCEVLADFIDAFLLGEGEEQIVEFSKLHQKAKELGWSKDQFLLEATNTIGGIYVPKFYEFSYKDDGTIEKLTVKNNAPQKIVKRIIEDLDNVYYPDNFVVPFSQTVHDRAMVEVMRGCIRGCRYCQAGFITRPLREKDKDVLCKDAISICKTTGYDEVSLSSLSTSDYSQIEHLLKDIIPYTKEKNINLSLPSLRIDNFSEEVLNMIKLVRQSSLTFAPEAGTQRMRDIINKNITEEDIFKTAKMSFENGYTNVKLYFMMGLPYETIEDIEGIGLLANKIVDLFYNTPNRNKSKPFNVTVSVAVFVPKPFTPFQFCPQDTIEMIKEKQRALIGSIKSKKIRVSWHGEKTSFLEAVFARGDRRLGKVIYNAYKKGCIFDSWDEHFKFDNYIEAFEEAGLDPNFFACRTREYDEIMPFDHFDYYVDKEFLIKENELAKVAATTPNCREKCSNCGSLKLKRGVCIEKR